MTVLRGVGSETALYDTFPQRFSEKIETSQETKKLPFWELFEKVLFRDDFGAPYGMPIERNADLDDVYYIVSFTFAIRKEAFPVVYEMLSFLRYDESHSSRSCFRQTMIQVCVERRKTVHLGE